MRFNLRERRWLLALAPSFLLINGWAFDVLAAYLVTHTGSTASEMMEIYRWWSYYDLAAKWVLPAISAILLFANHTALRPLGRVKQFAPWAIVAFLLAAETVLRFQLGRPQWQNTWLGQIQPLYLIEPSRIIAVPSNAAWQGFYMKPLVTTDWQYLAWELRPLFAFALALLLVTLVVSACRPFKQRLQAKRTLIQSSELGTSRPA